MLLLFAILSLISVPKKEREGENLDGDQTCLCAIKNPSLFYTIQYRFLAFTTEPVSHAEDQPI